MNTYINQVIRVCIFNAMLLIFLTACKKDQYYVDGGVSEPNFEGNMLQYLESKPFYFDTLATVIKLAGLQENFEKDEMTFFAPTDNSIKRALVNANKALYEAGNDTILNLDEIDSEIWRKYIMRYMFKGANKLNDYPQLDTRLLAVYPGQNYLSYNNTVFNIGVIYDDVNGIKYGGYRHIVISYLNNLDTPNQNWTTINVSSSDIKPINGVVHTLTDKSTFGFNTDFTSDVLALK